MHERSRWWWLLPATLFACTAVPPANRPTTAVAPAPPSDAVPEHRARELGVPFDGTPGPHNAITDVPGVRVGHATVIAGDGAHAVRTGVTAILPRTDLAPVFAGTAVLNGDGEMTGSLFVHEFGVVHGPIMLTGTGNVGIVHTAVLRWSIAQQAEGMPIFLPVVGETLDLDLNDYTAFGLREEHAVQALQAASGGAVAEGNVGGGTGMICHQWKGGIGTSSRVVQGSDRPYTVGALVQTNYGRRAELCIAGVPVGREIRDLMPSGSEPGNGDGSILVVLATDAPLLGPQCNALARRAALALGRMGSIAHPWSGDIFLAFTTHAAPMGEELRSEQVAALSPYATSALYAAAVQAVEEAIVNALVAARTMTGKNGHTVHALPHDRLREVLRRHGRLVEVPR